MQQPAITDLMDEIANQKEVVAKKSEEVSRAHVLLAAGRDERDRLRKQVDFWFLIAINKLIILLVSTDIRAIGHTKNRRVHWLVHNCTSTFVQPQSATTFVAIALFKISQ
jgi:hypothetical protein